MRNITFYKLSKAHMNLFHKDLCLQVVKKMLTWMQIWETQKLRRNTITYGKCAQQRRTILIVY